MLYGSPDLPVQKMRVSPDGFLLDFTNGQRSEGNMPSSFRVTLGANWRVVIPINIMSVILSELREWLPHLNEGNIQKARTIITLPTPSSASGATSLASAGILPTNTLMRNAHLSKMYNLPILGASAWQPWQPLAFDRRREMLGPVTSYGVAISKKERLKSGSGNMLVPSSQHRKCSENTPFVGFCSLVPCLSRSTIS